MILSSYQLPVLDSGGRYLLLVIYYGRWLDLHNRKDPGKTPFTNSQDISLGYNFLRQENSFLVPEKLDNLYSNKYNSQNGIKTIG